MCWDTRLGSWFSPQLISVICLLLRDFIYKTERYFRSLVYLTINSLSVLNFILVLTWELSKFLVTVYLSQRSDPGKTRNNLVLWGSWAKEWYNIDCHIREDRVWWWGGGEGCSRVLSLSLSILFPPVFVNKRLFSTEGKQIKVSTSNQIQSSHSPMILNIVN